MISRPLSWFQIFRLGLVQTALGSVVVLTTSTLNRIMVVELALPATLPGALMALHYAVQLLRPRFGHGSDSGRRRTPWILGGMGILALGGFGAAAATAAMGFNLWLGIVGAITSFILIGIGVGACGTTLLALLAKQVDERRRVAAATIVWLMMILGFVATTAIAGHLLAPYSPMRLVAVAGATSLVALALTAIAIWRIEEKTQRTSSAQDVDGERRAPFAKALPQVWAESRARRFAIFVFVSMLAYSAPELILEPFAGAAFGYTPGQSTTLASILHGGVLAGMVITAFACGTLGRHSFAALPIWMVGGCLASGAALFNLSLIAIEGASRALFTALFLLGLANGVYAVAAVGSMMSLAGSGRPAREGLRMGLWGAAQAIAFGMGGLVGTLAYDLLRAVTFSTSHSYAAVFAGEAVLFLISAVLAIRVEADYRPQSARPVGGADTFVSETGRSRL